MQPETLAGLLILFLGALRLARQPHGKLLGFFGAIVGAIIALLAIGVRGYIAPRPYGQTRAGVFVDVGPIRVVQLDRPFTDADACLRLSRGLELAVAVAGALTVGTVACAIGSLEGRCQKPRLDNPTEHPMGRSLHQTT
jgi:hypothetical protein